MRGRRSVNDTDEIKEINISPLIDMVFILLIFFIVTTVFVEEEGMSVDRPQSASASMSQENKTVVFEVNAKGQVLFEGADIGVGGVRAIVQDRLRQDDPPIIVKALKGALAGLVVSVIDEAKQGGAPSVSLATDKEA